MEACVRLKLKQMKATFESKKFTRPEFKHDHNLSLLQLEFNFDSFLYVHQNASSIQSLHTQT
eukprot:6609190-Karenia_brevis.AAC.1